MVCIRGKIRTSLSGIFQSNQFIQSRWNGAHVNYQLSEEQRQIQQMVREVAAKRVAPRADEIALIVASATYIAHREARAPRSRPEP